MAFCFLMRPATKLIYLGNDGQTVRSLTASIIIIIRRSCALSRINFYTASKIELYCTYNAVVYHIQYYIPYNTPQLVSYCQAFSPPPPPDTWPEQYLSRKKIRRKRISKVFMKLIRSAWKFDVCEYKDKRLPFKIPSSIFDCGLELVVYFWGRKNADIFIT